jgi:glycosyltransferase involved in cell wall biosynthesis
MKKVISIFSSHPVQYHSPLFNELAKSTSFKFKILYSSNNGAKISYDKDFNKEFKWNNFSLNKHEHYFLKKNNYRNSFINFFYYLFKIINCVKNSHAIIIFGWNSPYYLCAVLFSIFLSVRIILLSEENLIANENFLKKISKKIIFFIFFKIFDYFISIGTKNRNFYISHGVEKKKIIQTFYTVDTNFFKNSIKDNFLEYNIKKKYNLKKNDFVFIWVGKFIERKNPFEAIKAFQLLKKKKLHLLMVGSGKLLKSCKNYVQKNNIKNINFVGFKNQKQLLNFYRISHCLILSSKHETWGLVLNEAMSVGLPCIATTSSGATKDIIISNYNGYVYTSGSTKELCEKIKKISESYNYKILKKNTLLHIKKFALEATTFKILEGLKKIFYEKKK